MDEPPSPRPGPGPAPTGGPSEVPEAPSEAPQAPSEVPPAPSLAEPPPRRRPTRRWFLAGGLAVLAGGGAGVGAAFLRHRAPHLRPLPPEALVAAADAERALIADLVATTGGTGEVRVAIEQATANHRAHLAALDGLLGRYRRPARPSATPRGTPRTREQLHAAETAAAASAARRALRLPARPATLLASIAACEATHAELLG